MSTLLEKPEALDDADPHLATRALLDIPEFRHRVLPVSLEAYFASTRNLPTELLRGIIIDKVSKSPEHGHYGEEVYRILDRQISPEFSALHERALSFANSAPEPDVCVVRGQRSAFKLQAPTTAVLVIEVAFSSLALDRIKADIYAEANVTEYWIVRPATLQVEIYRQPTPAGYAEQLTVMAPAVLMPMALPGVSVNLAQLFA